MTTFDLKLAAAETLVALKARGWTMATAESCTGGLVAGALTDIPGSSDVVERGFVTYSNTAKSDLLGVAPDLIAAHGAVSRPVAEAMAQGALAHAPVDIAVAITGVAGPGGGTADKPVGLVHFAVATRSGALTWQEQRFGDIGREEVRAASVRTALEMLTEAAT